MPGDIEEVKDGLEVKEQTDKTIKPQIQELTINYKRILKKTAKILTFTNLYVKALKELKMLQQNNSQLPLIIFLLLK
jgi:hypothetical protein